MKVKVRVNIHGLFIVSSASLVEKLENKDEPKGEVLKDGKSEPMDVGGDEKATTNGPTNNTDANMSSAPPTDTQTENNTDVSKPIIL